jgi:hypothetical protein
MTKIKWLFIASLVIALLAMPLFAACPPEETTTAPPPTTTAPPPTTTTPPPPEYTLYIGGTMALTGAYAQDTAAVLAGYEDYAAYVNETHKLAPWRTEAFPDNVNLELLWRDDELNVEKALSIYEELKAKGILVFRGSGSPELLALMNLLNDDRIGATTMAIGPYLLSPPKTVFTQIPIYTDELAAIADWFMDNWEGTKAPKVAYLTADNAMGKSVVTPEMQTYLESIGYEFVGAQFVPLVPTSPPTTQLLWLKNNKVDLALGIMIYPGSEPTIKEAVRLGIGTNLDYKMTFGFGYTTTMNIFCRDMGESGNGVVFASQYPGWDEPVDGVQYVIELQSKYRPDKRVENVMYMHGVVEAMIQVEALRLAMLSVPVDELTPVDVLEYGFYKIKDLDTGGITSTPLTYGVNDVEGVDEVRVDQVQNGKQVKLGTWPLRHLYKHE